jgi:hypothetical protein
MKTCRICTLYLNCFILIHLIFLIQINSGFERKKRHNEYEFDYTIFRYKKFAFINAQLIYCHKDYLQHNFCVFADKFKIAVNNTFQCNNKYLGILITLPQAQKSPDNDTEFEDHFLYLTTKTGNNGEYLFLESSQAITLSCPLVKQ